MLAPSSVVKATAKTAMRGKFLKCVIAGAIFEFSLLVGIYAAELIDYVSPVFAVAVVFLVAFVLFLGVPLLLGLLRFFRRLIWGEEDNPVIVFHYFSTRELYVRAIKLGLFLGVRVGVAALVMYLPAILIDIFTGTALYDMLGISIPLWISNLWVLSVFFKAAAGVGLFFVCLKWYMAPFLYVADEEMEPLEAIHMSSIISRGTALDFFSLILSFALWILASFFMIPIVFTMPYFIAAYMVHCRFAVTHYNRAVDSMNEEAAPSFSAEV